jgi:hypothetical protein
MDPPLGEDMVATGFSFHKSSACDELMRKISTYLITTYNFMNFVTFTCIFYKPIIINFQNILLFSRLDEI